MSPSQVYDRIGPGYTGRREEPRIARGAGRGDRRRGQRAELGAGSGSYEPRDRPVVAVEPSAVIAGQRPEHAAPAVRAVAEALPFADGSFGAAMAVLSIRRWTDKARGLAEMRRVARGPVVLFGGSDRLLNTTWWLHDYFPAARRLVAGRNPPERISQVLGSVSAIPVPIPADCADGFEAAYWRRPQAILDPAIWRATSALSLISDTERASGMSRLSADLRSGDWERRYGHLLDLGELDLGYRVIVARRPPADAWTT